MRCEGLRAGRCPGKSRAGLTMVEVTITMVIVITFMMSSVHAFSASLIGMQRARRMTEASVFLESVMENVAAQDFENLLALNGNDFFDNNDATDSQFSTRLVVFLAQVDLLQIRATLTDLRTGEQSATLTTLRSRR